MYKEGDKFERQRHTKSQEGEEKTSESTQYIVLWWQFCPNKTVVTHANAFVEAMHRRGIPLSATFDDR